jgi:hypothetical protein
MLKWMIGKDFPWNLQKCFQMAECGNIYATKDWIAQQIPH